MFVHRLSKLELDFGEQIQAALTCAKWSIIRMEDSIIGSWVLNPERSKRMPGPCLKSAIRTYTRTPEGIVNSFHVVFVDGTTNCGTVTDKPDGSCVVDSARNTDMTYTVQRVNANQTALKAERAGKPIGEGSRTVSADGKVLIFCFKYTDSKGVLHDNVDVFDRQGA